MPPYCLLIAHYHSPTEIRIHRAPNPQRSQLASSNCSTKHGSVALTPLFGPSSHQQRTVVVLVSKTWHLDYFFCPCSVAYRRPSSPYTYLHTYCRHQKGIVLSCSGSSRQYSRACDPLCGVLTGSIHYHSWTAFRKY